MAERLPSGKAKGGKRHNKSMSPPLPEAIPGTSKQGHHSAKEVHKGCSTKPRGSKAAERGEHHRDRALEKLCAQSLSKSTGPRNIPSQGENNSLLTYPVDLRSNSP